jgi:hypothetical protein
MDCFACQDECFVNNPLDVKEDDEHALDFALHLSRRCRPWSLDFPCTSHALFTEGLSNHCQCLRRTVSEICTTFDAVPLSDL